MYNLHTYVQYVLLNVCTATINMWVDCFSCFCILCAGQGNFGKVLKARAIGILPDRPELNVVAVKVVKGDPPQSSAVDDLWAELQLMKSLKPHPNIVNLLGQCSLPGVCVCTLV